MSGKVRSNKDQKKPASKTTPRSVIRKSTFETGKSLQQNPETSQHVAINATPAETCVQHNPNSSPNVATDAKPGNKYDSKTPIIAYVHSVSPPKRNRRNTFDYATVSLQTSNEIKQEALLYSSHKRSLFEESEKCRTPIKLQKYTYTDDKKKIIINDMTYVSVPKPSEYAFQFTNSAACRYERVTVSEAITTCEEWDEVEIVGKIINLGSPLTVQRKGQNVSTTIDVCEALLADTTGSIRLDVWDTNIPQLRLGNVYRLTPVGIRLWSGQKKISTTVNTRVTVVEDESFTEIAVEHHDEARKLGEEVLEIDNILSVEKVEHFSKCVNCTRKLVQVTLENIVQCDRCGHSMRLSQCEQSIMAKVVAAQDDGQTVKLIIRKDVLKTILDVDINSLGEGEITKKLLMLQNLKLKYNVQSQIVNEISDFSQIFV